MKYLKIIIDFLVIIVNISFYIAIPPYFIFGPIQNSYFFLLINAAFTFGILIFRFRKYYHPFSLISFPPILIFLLLLIAQFISLFINGLKANILVLTEAVLNYLVFITYCTNLIKEHRDNIIRSFQYLINIFNSYAYLNIFLVIMAYLLISLNIIEPHTNNVNHTFTKLLSSNIENGTDYFYPGWISIQLSIARVGLLENIGTLTGLTHEPHVLAYLIMPAFFFSFMKKRSAILNIVLIVCTSITLLLSFSVSAFFTLLAIILIKVLSEFKRKKGILNILIITAALIIIFSFNLLSSYTEYVVEKVAYSTSSLQYSVNYFNSIISPKSVFGDGILLMNPRGINVANAGLVAFILYIIFYLTLTISIIRLVFSKNTSFHYLGLGFLYFEIHGFKITYLVFNMPYTLFILIILYWAIRLSKKQI